MSLKSPLAIMPKTRGVSTSSSNISRQQSRSRAHACPVVLALPWPVTLFFFFSWMSDVVAKSCWLSHEHAAITSSRHAAFFSFHSSRLFSRWEMDDEKMYSLVYYVLQIGTRVRWHCTLFFSTHQHPAHPMSVPTSICHPMSDKFYNYVAIRHKTQEDET